MEALQTEDDMLLQLGEDENMSREQVEATIDTFISIQARIKALIEACIARVKPLERKRKAYLQMLPPNFTNWVYAHLPRTKEGEIKAQNVKTTVGTVYYRTVKPAKALTVGQPLSKYMEDRIFELFGTVDDITVRSLGLRKDVLPCLVIEDLDLWEKFSKESGLIAPGAKTEATMTMGFGTTGPWGDTSAKGYFDRLLKQEDSDVDDSEE